MSLSLLYLQHALNLHLLGAASSLDHDTFRHHIARLVLAHVHLPSLPGEEGPKSPSFRPPNPRSRLGLDNLTWPRRFPHLVDSLSSRYFEVTEHLVETLSDSLVRSQHSGQERRILERQLGTLSVGWKSMGGIGHHAYPTSVPLRDIPKRLMGPYFRFGFVGFVEYRSQRFSSDIGEQGFGISSSLTRYFVISPSSSISLDDIGRDTPCQHLALFVNRYDHEESGCGDDEEIGRVTFGKGDAGSGEESVYGTLSVESRSAVVGGDDVVSDF